MPIPDLIKLCRALIQTPSVNGLHSERAVAERVLAFARQHGLAAETVAREADRPVVLLRSGPPTTPALIFVAHLDTVAAGDPAAWSYPPFAGEIVGDRLYGRGAIDNKGGLVAALAALLLLAQEPDCPALLVGVPDEESGATGELGIRFLQQQGLLSGSSAIYTYPGSDKIILGHRGVLRLRLEARGTAMHTGSRSWQNAAAGANTITALADLLLALDALPLARRHGSGLFAPYRTVITPTTIQGGSGPSMAPAACSAQLDIRLIPDVPQTEVETAIAECIVIVSRRHPSIQISVHHETALPPTMIAPDAPVVRALQQAVRAEPGRDPPLAVSGPANEAYLLNALGIATCVFGPDGGNAHAADEYLELASLPRVAAVYAETARLLARSPYGAQ